MANEHGGGARGLIPERLGHYRILAKIGGGNMGDVYSAIEEPIERPVALKVPKADLADLPDLRARFRREAQALARLLHPNVITVFNAGESDDGQLFMAMQLLDGAPLSTFLSRPEGVSLERKLDLMIQICRGLAAAHAGGIIHRDLKPSNLFVQTDGLVKIIDFGVARVDGSSITVAGTMLGTVDYMSPEQVTGATVTERSDIFSLGEVFYFMLSGRKPFDGRDLPVILRQIQYDEPQPLRGAPVELVTLVSQAMAKNPEHRPAKVEQLLNDLVRFQHQYQTETRRLAFVLRSQVEETALQAGAVKEHSLRLGISCDEPAAVEQLRRDHSFLVTRGGLESAMLERAKVLAATRAVNELHARVVEGVERTRAWLASFEHIESDLDAGRLADAIAGGERLLEESGGISRVKQLLERAYAVRERQQQRSDEVTRRLLEGRSALAAGNLAMARACCQQAAALAGDSAGLQDDAAALEREVSSAERELAADLRDVLDQVTEAMDSGAFDDAETILDDAVDRGHDTPAIAAARARLSQARAAAHAEELRTQLSAEAIRRARAAFRRGRYAESLQQLASFLALEPQADAVAEELKYLRGLHDSITRAGASANVRVRELIGRASAASEQGRFEDARTELQQALRLDPTSVAVAEQIDDVLNRELDARLTRERTQIRKLRSEIASAVMAAAAAAKGRGYPELAMRAAVAAQRIAVDGQVGAAFLADVRRELYADDSEIFPLDSTPLPTTVSVEAAPNSVSAAEPDARWVEKAGDWIRGGLMKRKA